ncbi:MAG: phosphatidate cytidylyltransferase [Candidatus Saccharibacteria bacterium]|nr:phosphatidate cytidylyltransferase [Candidatus Saccharibacteria bacterium]
MDKNFRVRVLCGFGLLAAAIVSLFTFDGILFKILFGIFAMISGMELLSFFKKTAHFKNVVLAIFEVMFLIYGSMYVAQIGVIEIWLLIFGVCSYDVFAYLFGKAFGGKIFKKSRPFPHISKNKTWEGTALGLVSSAALTLLLLAVLGRSDYIYLLCGPLALMGDLFESYLKRQFKVKDSNEIVIKNKFFEKLEFVVGGTEGHGGFLDRLDSLVFTGTILLIVSAILF